VVESGLELNENILSLDEISIYNLDSAGGGLGRLKGVAGVAEEAEGAVVEHQDESSGAGREHRLSLIGASVALSH
jgi:hypothetical protein